MYTETNAGKNTCLKYVKLKTQCRDVWMCTLLTNIGLKHVPNWYIHTKCSLLLLVLLVECNLKDDKRVSER